MSDLQYPALVALSTSIRQAESKAEDDHLAGAGKGIEGEEEQKGKEEMSANLPAFMWRDPAEAYERLEAGTCQGCALIVRYRFDRIGYEPETIEACAKGRPFGKKCKHYVEAVDGK